MDSGGLQERGIGSVMDSYGERITDSNSVGKKLQKNYSEILERIIQAFFGYEFLEF